MPSGFMLTENGQWVGPPALKLKTSDLEMVLDGRKRLKEHKMRGLKTDIPWLIARSHLQAIKFLILAHHQSRAAMHAVTYAPEFAERATTSTAVILGVSRNMLQPYIRALKDPSERHKLPRRGMKVVSRALALRRRMLEGDINISITDIEEVLGEFLE